MMTSNERRITRWIPFVLGLAIVIFVVWFGSKEETPSAVVASRLESKQAGNLGTQARNPIVPALRVAPGKRLHLDLADLPEGEPVAIALGLSDEARGPAIHGVRLVSTRGDRFDLEATPLPGPGSGVRLEIDRAYLGPGLYMIVLDTFEDHPLRLRRYVLEIK